MEHTAGFSRRERLAYSAGQVGWSTLMNLVNLHLAYFYLPPADTGLPNHLPASVAIGATAAALVLALSRAAAAFVDPLVASWSDQRPAGARRRPFLLWATLPTALGCALSFTPIVSGPSAWNLIPLGGAQIVFYIGLTAYVTPFLALTPDISRSQKERLEVSMLLSIAFAVGVVVASLLPLLSQLIGHVLDASASTRQQLVVWLLSAGCGVLMLLPAWVLREPRQEAPAPADSAGGLAELRAAFSNPDFACYAIADFSYSSGMTVIMTGLLYYITVLLRLDEAVLGMLLPAMVVGSFLFYPLISRLTDRVGYKRLVVGALAWMGLLFLGVPLLGRVPAPAEVQAALFAVLFAVPLASMGVLPQAVLAEIAAGDPGHEGRYVAGREVTQKLGQVAGLLLFLPLMALGHNVGDDLGVRLSGTVSGALCLLAGVWFLRYNEQRVRAAARAASAPP